MPTLNGPEISSWGAAVICHACRIPMKMISALINPNGKDPNTEITGSAKTRTASAPSALSA